MPVEWLHVLTHPNIKNPDEVLYKLKYVYTVEDVFDLLEVLQVKDYYASELAKREKDGGI